MVGAGFVVVSVDPMPNERSYRAGRCECEAAAFDWDRLRQRTVAEAWAG